jgi:hypothetical protein
MEEIEALNGRRAGWGVIVKDDLMAEIEKRVWKMGTYALV